MDYERLRGNLNDALAELKHLAISEDLLEINEALRCTAGGYGDVYRATLKVPDHASSRVVAVKELRAVGDDVTRIRVAIHLARELRVWARLKHPNVLELIGYYLNAQMTTARLISPFMTNGNIDEYFEAAPSPVSDSLRLKLLADVLNGLVYLHSSTPPICHADIKPENVLVTDRIEAVLCDFGLARITDGQPSGLTTTKSIKGSIRYMSPELLDEEPIHTLESDVWAYGCLVFKVMTSTTPYSNSRSDQQVLLALALKQQPASLSTLQDEGLRTLLTRCWDINPSARPSASVCQVYLPTPTLNTIPSPHIEVVITTKTAWKTKDLPGASLIGDASLLAILRGFSNDAAVSVHEPKSGNLVATLEDYHNVTFKSAYVTAGGRALVLHSSDSLLYVWPLVSKSEPRQIGALSTAVQHVAFARDCTFMAHINLRGLIEITAWDPNISDPTTQTQHTPLASYQFTTSTAWVAGTNPGFQSLAITPDGSFLAAGRTQHVGQTLICIEVIDLRTARLLARLTGHHNPVVSLAFIADGARLQSSTADEEVKFWDTSALVALSSRSSSNALYYSCLGTFTPQAPKTDGLNAWWQSSPDFEWVARAEDTGHINLYSPGDSRMLTLSVEVSRAETPLKRIMVLFSTNTSGTIVTQNNRDRIQAWSFEITECDESESIM